MIVSDNYMPVAKALEKVKKGAVIDGELVAIDEHGISRFQLLQNALRTAANLRYCVFDVMFLDGKDQEVVIVGFTAPRRTRPHFGALVLAVREGNAWRYVGHVGTGFSHAALKSIHAKLWPLRTPSGHRDPSMTVRYTRIAGRRFEGLWR